MKNRDKVINDRKNRIMLNNIDIIEYKSDSKILCKCKKCEYETIDNYRNLISKKCRYCALIEKSDIIKKGDVKIIKIDNFGDGAFIHLRCNKGHLYKQDRRNLLANKGCKLCYLKNKSFDVEDIKIQFLKIHGNYFSYNFKQYKNVHSKIEIICNKGHRFEQKVSNHLQGKGCPICRESLGERIISFFLDKHNIQYIKQKKFDNCKYINKLSFDFYIPIINTLIEYDGIQHFEPIKLFGGEEEFKKTQIRDKIKTEYCVNNNIQFVRISYMDNIENKMLKLLSTYYQG